MLFRVMNGGRLSVSNGRFVVALGVVQVGSPQGGGSPTGGSPIGGSPFTFDFLFQMQIFASIYDSANDRLIFSTYRPGLGSPTGGSPDNTGTSWILVSDDGGVSFTLVRIVTDNGSAYPYLFNNVTDSEYIAVVGNTANGPLVFVATHADPLTWTIRDTITEVVGLNDFLSGVAYDGNNTLVALAENSDNLYTLRSIDAGANWTYQDYDEENHFTIDSPPGDYSWRDIVYDGSHFVALVTAFDQNSQATWSASSVDGTTFTETQITHGIDQGPILGTDGNGTVLFIGHDIDTAELITRSSTDNGATWNSSATTLDFLPEDGFNFTPYAIMYDSVNARYVADFVFGDGVVDVDRVYSLDPTGSPLTWVLRIEALFTVEPQTIVYQAGAHNMYWAGGITAGFFKFDLNFANVTYLPP